MPRKFKLRNGAIVEEWHRKDTHERDGFIDDYRIIHYGQMSENDKGSFGSKANKNWLCLGFNPTEGFPVSNVHGKDFDIVEEIFDNKPENQT